MVWGNHAACFNKNDCWGAFMTKEDQTTKKAVKRSFSADSAAHEALSEFGEFEVVQQVRTQGVDALVWVALEYGVDRKFASKLPSNTAPKFKKNKDGTLLFPALANERLSIRRALCGDQTARMALVSQHEPLIEKLVRRYSKTGVSSDDLRADAQLALLSSIERFDLSRTTRFVSYLQWWVVDAMQKAVSEGAGPLKVPRRALAKQIKQVQPNVEDSTQTNELDSLTEDDYDRSGEPTFVSDSAEDISQEIENGAESDRSHRPSVAQSVDISSLADYCDESISIEEDVSNRQALGVIAKLWEKLDAREQQIVELHFGITDAGERTLGEIAQDLGITRQRVGQVLKAALEKLQDAVISESTTPLRAKTASV